MLGPLETLLPGLLGRGVGPVGGLAPRPMGPRAGLRLVLQTKVHSLVDNR